MHQMSPLHAIIIIISVAVFGFIFAYLLRTKFYDDDFISSQLYPFKIDLNRYAGRWHEIAALPNSFQKDCICSTADYTLDENNGTISVLNTCQTNDKQTKEAKAVGYSTNNNNTWLKVNFLPQYLLGNDPAKVKSWPFSIASADYWILHVDNDYGHAIVGSPSKEFLWFLSRTPQILKTDYTRLANIAKDKGYATNALNITCGLLVE